ncbi:MAG: hypothetical protein R2820_03955 [Cyclobacteriaceae bacterium]
MRKILTIEFEIPGLSEANVSYWVQKSLLDSDLVIIRPKVSYYGHDRYDGKPSLDESDSRYFREAVSHWMSEIDEYLGSGKILFVILDNVDQFYVKSGNKEFSGTGRSRRTIHIVNQKTNYDLIGRSEYIMGAEGENLKCSSQIFRDFHSDFRELVTYKAYLKSASIEPIFTTVHGSRTLGGIEKIGSGRIVFLPFVDFERKELVGKKKNGEEYWTNKAIQLGNRFIQHLISAESQILNKTSKSIQPDWVFNNEYQLASVLKIKRDIKITDDKIQKLSLLSNSLKSDLDRELELTDLLYETGKPLENAVTKGLKLLGFKAENYDDGELELDQVITSPEKARFIGECEGKDNKAIDIAKLRQLSDAINEDFEKQDVREEAFGLLFGNPQRLIQPNHRTETFTSKCVAAAKRRNIGLILTSELFVVCQYLSSHNDKKFAKRCREAIRNGLGQKIDLPEVPTL